jgi:hypothetical protein
MGRTLKRVPLDFSWPLNKLWGGYVNPFYHQSTPCPDCKNGYSPEYTRLENQWYGRGGFDPIAYGATPLTVDHPGIQARARRNIERSPEFYGHGEYAVQREARRLLNECFYDHWSCNLVQADVDALIAADRLWDFTRTPRNEAQAEIVRQKIADGGNSWLPESNGYVPTAQEVNDWAVGPGMGHDSSNAWTCIKARMEREGLGPDTCASCGGDPHVWPSPEIKAAYENWTETEPPVGDGFQLWETTSEGSPISPVFATMEELCQYAAQHCSVFASEKVSAERWREMLDADHVYVEQKIGNHTMIFM